VAVGSGGALGVVVWIEEEGMNRGKGSRGYVGYRVERGWAWGEMKCMKWAAGDGRRRVSFGEEVERMGCEEKGDRGGKEREWEGGGEGGGCL